MTDATNIIKVSLPTSAIEVAKMQTEIEGDAEFMLTTTVENAEDYSFADELLSDLASKLDVACFGKLFVREGEYYWFCRHYLPEETIETSTNSQYQGWAQDGFLTETPGNVIDYDWIEGEIIESDSKYTLEQVGYDPYHATQLVSHMLDQGVHMVELRPTALNFSEPMKELEKLIVAGRFHYDGNPVMTWMFSNVTCHTDAKDNIYPRKAFPENKIDGVIALLMALKLALAEETTTSIYESEGLMVL
jgi:phage terminase large subunit-like protein